MTTQHSTLLPQPPQPNAAYPMEVLHDLPLSSLGSEPWWDACLSHESPFQAKLKTAEAQWNYSAYLRFSEEFPSSEQWLWLEVQLHVLRGQVGLGFEVGTDGSGEVRIPVSETPQLVWIPIPESFPSTELILRNVSPSGASQLFIRSLRILQQTPLRAPIYQQEYGWSGGDRRKLSIREQREWEQNGILEFKDLLQPEQKQVCHDLWSELSAPSHRTNHLPYLYNWHTTHRDLYDLCLSPQVEDVVEELLGEPGVLWDTSLYIKEANSQEQVLWHQDAQHWEEHFHPLNAVSVSFVLTEADKKNGGLCWYPGSHKEGRKTRENQALLLPTGKLGAKSLYLKTGIPSAELPSRDEQQAQWTCGDVAFHHPLLIHSSPANHDSRIRVVLVARFLGDSCEVRNTTLRLATQKHKSTSRHRLQIRPLNNQWPERQWTSFPPPRDTSTQQSSSSLQWDALELDRIPLVHSSLKVSRFCLGTLPFGSVLGEGEVEELLNCAYTAGINFFDTANIYNEGAAEWLLGRWLRRNRIPRDKVVIATKVRGRWRETPDGEGLSRTQLRKALDSSLLRLGTDYIDLYQLHWHDTEVPIEETFETLEELKKEGKIRHTGLCNFHGWRLEEAFSLCKHRGWEQPITFQAQYSLLWRTFVEREYLECCEKYGVSILPYSPLGSGFLAGGYKKGQTPSSSARSWEVQHLRYNAKNWEILKVVREMAEENKVSTAQVALQWLFRQRGIDTLLLGCRTKEQLWDSLQCTRWELTDADLQKLGQVSQPQMIF